MLLLGVQALAQPTARVKGTVLDENSQPLVGVTVLINQAGQTSNRGTTTDAKGLFSFDNLRPDTRYDSRPATLVTRSRRHQTFSSTGATTTAC